MILQSGQTRQFDVSGTWSDGSSSTPSVTYSATGGTITGGGLYTAGSTAGTYRIIAANQQSTLRDTSFVTITVPAPSLTSISLSPSSVAVSPGGGYQFNVSGTWTNGATNPPPVTYSATGGTVTSAGLFVAGTTAGTYRVIATSGATLADTSAVTVAVTAPTLTSVVITPGSASLQTGGSRQFVAGGTWSDGTSAAPPVVWSATGGTISSAGLYIAGSSAGSFRVIAQQLNGTRADTAEVTVTAPLALTAVLLTPAFVGLDLGASQQFAVSGTYSNGSTGTPSVTYSATGGSINNNGRYTAGNTPGTYQVIARQQGGTLADTSVVTVGARVTQFVMTPSTVNLLVGGTQQFQTSATWSDGVSRPVSVTYSATGGTVSASGLYTAGLLAGSAAVIAVCSCGIADTSVVSLSLVPTLAGLWVSPRTVTLAPGGTQQYSAQAMWTDGSTTLPAVTFSATGGTITPQGLYTVGSSTGSFQVIVSAQGKADTSQVSVVSYASGLPSAPGAPQFSVQSAGATTSAIRTSWTAGAGATSYRYSARSSVDGVWAGQSSTTDSLGVTLTSVPNGASIFVCVWSRNTAGESTQSACSGYTVPIVGAEPPPPPPPAGTGSMYFNSAEAGCGTDANTVLCDDFEDGTWYEKDCDQANTSGGLLQTDGWCGNIYANPITPAGAAVCGAKGFRSNCAAHGGLHTSVGGVNMAQHRFYGGAVNEAWWRVYFQPQNDYDGGHEKMFGFVREGGQLVSHCYNYFGGETIQCIPMQHQERWIGSNLAPAVTIQRGHWYYFEVHVKLNTPGFYDGVLEFWMDDCGTAGTSCPLSPTRRSYDAKVLYRSASESSMTLDGIWIENWANAATYGSMLYDNVRVSRGGPVGPRL